MIKFLAHINDRPTLGMGLSDANLQKLREGKPILIHLSELGLPYDLQLLIFHGATEQDMVNDLKSQGADFTGVPIREAKEPH